MRKTLSWFVPVFTVATIALLAVPAAAVEVGAGGRLGASIDPDDFKIGVHVRFTEMLEQVPNLEVEPSLEIGWGDEGLRSVDIDYTTIRGNLNVLYSFPVGDSGFEVKPLMGLAIYHISFDDGPVVDIDDETEFGLNIGGVAEYRGFGVEASFGIGDIPDFQVVARYTYSF